MGSHYHLRHYPTSPSYCYCCPPYSQCHHHPPPPAPPDCHPLYHPPPQPQLHSAQTHLPKSHQTHPHFQERYLEEEIETQHTIASLLRRISTLESALRGRSTSSSSHSLRAAAARTIQTHFRAFLLHRSRTLRQLKDLASIKSALSYLKSSVCKQTYFDYDAVYHQARTLVFKLDTIKGCDPMIRDGKISVRRELNKFLGFIDGFCIDRRYERLNVKNRVSNGERKSGNVKCGGLKSTSREKLRGLVERIDKLAEELDEEDESEVIQIPGDGSIKKKGSSLKQFCEVQPKVKKSVSFVDSDGKIYRMLRRNSESTVDEDDDEVSVDKVNWVSRDFEDDICREVEEIGFGSKEDGDDDDDDDDDDDGSDDEKDLRRKMRSGDNFERKMYNQGEVDNMAMYNQGEVDNMAFAAPLPLKMEKRANLIDNLTRGGN